MTEDPLFAKRVSMRKISRRVVSPLRFALALGFGIGAASCDTDLGQRAVSPEKTLGEIVYRETCQRVAYTSQLSEHLAGQRPVIDATGVSFRPMCSDGEAPPEGAPKVMTAVGDRRQSIVSAIDTAVPKMLYDDADSAVRAMLPGLEGPDAQRAADKAGAVLARMAQDSQATQALARLGYREGFFPRAQAGGLLRSLLGAPELHSSLVAVLPLLADSTVDVHDAKAASAVSSLLFAISREMLAASVSPVPQSPDRTLNLVHRFLFTESPELVTLPAGQAYYAIRRDHRGFPLIALQGTSIPFPYVDKDKDGYADANPDGRLIDSNGIAIPFVTPFVSNSLYSKDLAAARDLQGRALLSPVSQPLYSYFNLDPTVLAGLLREAPSLFDEKRDIPFRLAQGASFLLGPRKSSKKTYPTGEILDYLGYDENQSPLIEISYGFLQLLTYSDNGSQTGADLNRLLRAAQLLFQTQENVLARNLDAVAKGFDESKKPDYNTAILREDSTLYDDLAPIVVRLLRDPDLVRDVLLAFGDPATADLGQIISLLATDSSQLFMNQDQLDTRGQPADLSSVVGTLGKHLVDRGKPDSDFDKNPENRNNNRSALQRILQIVHDANQIPFCNKDGAYVNIKIVIDIKIAGPAKPCTLFRLDDLALYYLLSIGTDSVKSRDPYTNFLNSITDNTLRTQAQILDGLGLLDNLVGIPGFGKYPTPAMLARILFQENSRRAEFFKTTLDFGSCEPARPGTLCSNQNLEWQKYYDGALFSLEAVHPRDGSGKIKANVNFYTAFRPIVDAFAKHDECIERNTSGACLKWRNAGQILVDLLSVLHRHWPTVQSTFFGTSSYGAQQKRSGLSAYEPLIAKLMATGDLWASSRALAAMLANVRTDDGSNVPLSTVVARFARFLFDPEAARLSGPLTFRDGRTLAVRNDGKPTFSPTGDPIVQDVLSATAAGRVTPYDLLAFGYQKRRELGKQNSAAASKWNEGMSALADLYLTARTPSVGTYQFATPRFRPIVVAGLDLLKHRVSAHGNAQEMSVWVKHTLFPNLVETLTGPIAAASFDVLGQVAASDEARPRLYRLFSGFLSDQGPQSQDAPRFRALLYSAADAMQLLADDQDLVPIVRSLSGLLDPEVAQGLLAILRRGLPHDDKQVLVRIGQNLFTPDTLGRYPAFLLSDAMGEIDRSAAGMPGVLGTNFTIADYEAVLRTVGQFLSDERRGVRRLLDILNTRHGSP